MANTTFKGPVRSQNGFQELVDGAWVPVAGGGGIQTILATPDTPIVTLNFTAPGQTIIVTGTYLYDSLYTLNIAPVDGITEWQFMGNYIQVPSGMGPLELEGFASNPPYTAFREMYLTFTFANLTPNPTYGTAVAKIFVSGWATV